MHEKNLHVMQCTLKKNTTADAVLAKKRNPENMTYEEFRKVLALLRRKKYKSIPRTANDLLIRYFQWVQIEKREIIVIAGQKHNLNAGNSTDCAEINISDNAADELIATAINAGDSTDFSDDAAGGLIAATNAGNLADCSDILI